MTSLHPLLLMPDRLEANRLAALIGAAVYAAPAYVDTTRGALDLLAQRTVGVLILDAQLRGETGVQALTRLRTRYPALPVIMVSDARAENTAIDAFHLGVLDYIPKKRGYGDLVVRLVTQLATNAPLTAQTRLLDVPDTIPAALLDPTYQNRLRLIGRHCDALGLYDLAIVETARGVIVRALTATRHAVETLEFDDRHFAHLVSEAIDIRGHHQPLRPPALLPTGYEDILRALGWTLDQRHAERVTIVELERCLIVCGQQPMEGAENTAYGRFEWVIEAEEIRVLSDTAYQQRRG